MELEPAGPTPAALSPSGLSLCHLVFLDPLVLAYLEPRGIGEFGSQRGRVSPEQFGYHPQERETGGSYRVYSREHVLVVREVREIARAVRREARMVGFVIRMPAHEEKERQRDRGGQSYREFLGGRAFPAGFGHIGKQELPENSKEIVHETVEGHEPVGHVAAKQIFLDFRKI